MNTSKYKYTAKKKGLYTFTNFAQHQVHQTLVLQADTGTKATPWTPVCGRPRKGTTSDLLIETKQHPVNPPTIKAVQPRVDCYVVCLNLQPSYCPV